MALMDRLDPRWQPRHKDSSGRFVGGGTVYQDNNQRMRDRDKSRRRFLSAIKLTLGCVDCGYREHPAALDFDHRENEVKKFSVSRTPAGRKLLTIVEELMKCDVRCSNCHRVRHYAR